MDIKMDYLSEDGGTASGYRNLGVGGGEGNVLLGDAATNVLDSMTSFLFPHGDCARLHAEVAHQRLVLDVELTLAAGQVVGRCGGVICLMKLGYASKS